LIRIDAAGASMTLSTNNNYVIDVLRSSFSEDVTNYS